MTQLHIQLLGSFNITVDGSPLPGFHQLRLQSFLAYLLLHRQAPQSRQSIAFQFWPDSTEKQSRVNLRQLLHRLRQTLPHADSYLDVTTETIRWRPAAPVALDVARFEMSISKASHARRPTHRLKAFQEADAAYGGDLLPGLYEEWILAERERLRSLFAFVLTELSTIYEAERQYSAAIEVSQRLLNHDPLQESSYRQLMQLYLLNQDRGAALAAYHRCTTTLQEELGVDPGPSTKKLYQRILQLDTEVTDQARPTEASAALSLIGRRRAWRRLEKAWQGAQQGTPTLLLIQGEAGIGKTRLAQELGQKVRRQGLVALHTQAHASGGAGPYAPLTKLLRSEPYRAALAKLELMWLVELVRLLPELGFGREDIPAPAPMTDAWQRNRFHEGLVRGVLGAAQPLLIHFDDLQWCDLETLAWLRFLLTYEASARLLIVATVRDDEMRADHPVNKLRYDLEQRGRCQVITLSPLDRPEVAELAQEMVGESLTTEAAGRLYAETEGNPLFLVEMLRARAAMPPGAAWTLPSKVEAVIQWRLGQLDPQARQVAACAAVIGRNFSHALLAKVSGMDEQHLVQNLDQLWRRRMIREGDSGTYDFSHDLLREAAYDQLSPIQLRHLHNRLATLLQEEHAQDVGAAAGLIAHHYQQAGDPKEARRFFIQAGQHAASQFANGDAAVFYSQAIELAGENEIPDQEMADLYGQLGRVLELDAKYEEAFNRYKELEKLAGRLGNQEILLASLVSQATLLATPTPLHDPVEGEVLASKALELAQELHDQAYEAKILWIQLLNYGFMNRTLEATAFGERSLDLARKLQLREQMAFTLNDLGFRCYRQLGPLRKARDVLMEASELWREIGNLPMLADCLSSICDVNIGVGEYEAALALSAEAQQISQSIGNLWGQSYSLYKIGWVHWEYGRADRAIAVMEECIRLGQQAGFLGAQTGTRRFLSMVYAELGAEQLSLQILHEALSIAEDQYSLYKPVLLATLSRLHLQQEHLTQADDVLELIKQDPHALEKFPQSASFATAKLALLRGNHERAVAAADELTANLRLSGEIPKLAEALFLQGQILRAVNQPGLAAKRLHEAYEFATKLGSRRLLWQISFALSQLEEDTLEASRLRRQAREIVATIADHAGSPELRASFLTRPEVRAVLAG